MSKKIYGIPVSTPINPAKVNPEVPEEKIAAAVSAYMEENPITAEGIGALAADKLPEAVDDALAQAKASGEFDGPQGETGATGPQGPKGDTGADGKTPAKGTDYFTPAEIESIANQAAGKVTPEGIGARPNTWTPTAEEAGARPNTWLPTIAEIGAAPAGYGLGSVLHPTNVVSNPDDAINTGWYGFFNTANNIFGFTVGVLEVISYTGLRNKQIFYPMNSNCSLERYRYEGAWQPWEWVNPPVKLDNTEYRTTERWNGKAVYTKLINFGNMPNTTTSGVSHGISGITQVIRCIGQNITAGQTIPSNWKGNYTSIYADKSSVYIHSAGDSTASAAYAQLWYTKD